MKYVFGPVPSRRLGKSLGIDPVPPKTCNWNCVYCQLGRTRPLTNARQEYVPTGMILEQLGKVLDSTPENQIDWITIVGSGEPTLHSKLNKIIRNIKTLTKLPLAIITNGSLLHLPEVRNALVLADAVLPSLDAGTHSLYRKVNRPLGALTFETLVTGLMDFRKIYAGQLWIEVMLVAGLNDSDEALENINEVLEQIQPDQVHINTPNRPPAEHWVHPPTANRLHRAKKLLQNTSMVIMPSTSPVSFSQQESLAGTILNIITRHPMQENELRKGLPGISQKQIKQVLFELKLEGKVKEIERYNRQFWTASTSVYELEKIKDTD